MSGTKLIATLRFGQKQKQPDFGIEKSAIVGTKKTKTSFSEGEQDKKNKCFGSASKKLQYFWSENKNKKNPHRVLPKLDITWG